MIIFKDSESLGFLGFFFYVILKLSIVRREKRMKKSKNLKRIGAVMLSLVLAVSTVFYNKLLFLKRRFLHKAENKK